MSHLIVVAEFPLPEPDAGEISEDPDEAYPLLGPGRESRSPHKKREEVTLTQTFSLLPDFTLSYQVQRYREVHSRASLMVSVLNNTVVIASRNH